MLFDHLAYFQISGEISYKQNQVNYRKNDHIDMKFESRIQVNSINIKKGKTCGNSRMKVKSSDIFSFLYFYNSLFSLDSCRIHYKNGKQLQSHVGKQKRGLK